MIGEFSRLLGRDFDPAFRPARRYPDARLQRHRTSNGEPVDVGAASGSAASRIAEAFECQLAAMLTRTFDAGCRIEGAQPAPDDFRVAEALTSSPATMSPNGVGRPDTRPSSFVDRGCSTRGCSCRLALDGRATPDGPTHLDLLRHVPNVTAPEDPAWPGAGGG